MIKALVISEQGLRKCCFGQRFLNMKGKSGSVCSSPVVYAAQCSNAVFWYTETQKYLQNKVYMYTIQINKAN